LTFSKFLKVTHVGKDPVSSSTYSVKIKDSLRWVVLGGKHRALLGPCNFLPHEPCKPAFIFAVYLTNLFFLLGHTYPNRKIKGKQIQDITSSDREWGTARHNFCKGSRAECLLCLQIYLECALGQASPKAPLAQLLFTAAAWLCSWGRGSFHWKKCWGRGKSWDRRTCKKSPLEVCTPCKPLDPDLISQDWTGVRDCRF
jgi:hypothetical protein